MVRKKNTPKKNNKEPIPNEQNVKVKIVMNNEEDSSGKTLIAVTSGYTDVGVFHDKRKLGQHDQSVKSFDHNEILRNENVNVNNEESNDRDNHLLGCTDMEAFQNKLKTHFITYFEKQAPDSHLCGLHSLNNAVNTRMFNEDFLRKIQHQAHNDVNDLVFDGRQVDEFENEELGNFSMDVLILAVKEKYQSNLECYSDRIGYIPSRFIIAQQGNKLNHFFALHGVPGDKWLLKDSLNPCPYMIGTYLAKSLLQQWLDVDGFSVYYFDDLQLQGFSNDIDYNYMRERRRRTYVSNFVWVEKSSLQDDKVAILHLLPSTKLSELITDGHNCRYIDQQHLNDKKDGEDYPACLSDSEDSLIDDKLEHTDNLNRQTFSSVVTILNYILCLYSGCSFEKVRCSKNTTSKAMIEKYKWIQDDLGTMFGCKQEGWHRQISLKKFDGYLRSIVGENNVVFEKLPETDWKNCTG